MTKQETKAGARTEVEQDYMNGKWVPSYYGNRFTVCKKGRIGGEQDTSFKVETLVEAQNEAKRRNALFSALQQLTKCNLTDANCASFEVANKRIRNIAGIAIAAAEGRANQP